MTMLGASLLSYGQATGTTGGRSQSTTDRVGSPSAQGTTTRDTTMEQSRAAGDRQQAAGQADFRGEADQAQSGQAQRDTSRPQDTQALREMSWEDAQAADVQLTEVPEAARNTINTVASGAKVQRLSKDGQDVYCATVDRANEEDLKIFVQNDGSVIKTTQQIKFSDAPASVRSAISKQLGGADAEPKAIHRVIANEETSYEASTGQQGQTLRVDSSGKVLDSKGQPGATDTQRQQQDD